MVYILKGKVSWLRLVAIIWTASSDAARQACGKAAAARTRRGNAQVVTSFRRRFPPELLKIRWKEGTRARPAGPATRPGLGAQRAQRRSIT